MKIGDICKYGAKSSIKAGEAVCDAEYQFFTSSEDEGKRYTEYQFDGEGIIMGTGGKATVHYYSGKYSVSTDCIVLLPDERIRCKYLYYFFEANKHILEAGFKGAGLKHTNKKYISSIEFGEIPLITIQDKIISNLDKVKEIISNKRRQMEILDELIKARFVEMFGDPVLNPLGWDVKPVIDICDCMVPGRDKPKSFTGDIPWITIDDLIVNGITFRSKQGLGLKEVEINEVKRKTIPVGSVVMSCVGNLGICSIAGNEMIINQQLHSFQCHSEINNIFLMYYLGQRKEYMEKQATSTTVLYMNKSICNSIPVMIPDLALQEKFASFVAQVDKSKVKEMHI